MKSPYAQHWKKVGLAAVRAVRKLPSEETTTAMEWVRAWVQCIWVSTPCWTWPWKWTLSCSWSRHVNANNDKRKLVDNDNDWNEDYVFTVTKYKTASNYRPLTAGVWPPLRLQSPLYYHPLPRCSLSALHTLHGVLLRPRLRRPLLQLPRIALMYFLTNPPGEDTDCHRLCPVVH